MKIEEFKLERYFARYEFGTPHLLCCSDCETLSVAELLEMDVDFEASFASLRLGYTESQGHPVLREEIARLYANISTEEIIVLSGAEEGIFALMNSLLEAGDHVIVQFPAYQSLFEVARAIGCEVSLWTLDEEKNWEPDLETLESLITKKTKLIVINFPHNPTGAMINREDFEAIAEIAGERDITLFSDEVYRFSEYDPTDRLAGMCDIYDKSITLGVMSKSFGLAGLRIGWVASRNREILNKIAGFKDYTTICNSAPSEMLAITALRHKEKILERNLEIITNNLLLLDRFFENRANLFRWVRPKAGPIAFPRLKSDTGIEEFCNKLREGAGVLLLPGSQFNFGDSHFRIGFGRKEMASAVERLEEYLDSSAK